jgi:hypothetical protein
MAKARVMTIGVRVNPGALTDSLLASIDIAALAALAR